MTKLFLREILEDDLWGLYTCNIYIVTTSAYDFKQILSNKTNFLTHYTLPNLCVLHFTEIKA